MTDVGPVIFPKLYRRQTNWAARNKAAVSSATLQEFLDAQKKDQCYRTDDFLANGEHGAQKFLFATLVKAGKTILFEPDGICAKRTWRRSSSTTALHRLKCSRKLRCCLM